MTRDVVKNWFGEDFAKLSPELQDLHVKGGVLAGEVTIRMGNGLAGVVGRRLSRKLGLPGSEKANLVVSISHHDGVLHWDRCFNDATEMKSTFVPVGTIGQGYWLEKTGPLQLKLTVDIKNNGWFWRILEYKFLGIPLPAWLFPGSKAYKCIENGDYTFFVGFSVPLLGQVLSYSGSLKRTE